MFKSFSHNPPIGHLVFHKALLGIWSYSLKSRDLDDLGISRCQMNKHISGFVEEHTLHCIYSNIASNPGCSKTKDNCFTSCKFNIELLIQQKTDQDNQDPQKSWQRWRCLQLPICQPFSSWDTTKTLVTWNISSWLVKVPGSDCFHMKLNLNGFFMPSPIAIWKNVLFQLLGYMPLGFVCCFFFRFEPYWEATVLANKSSSETNLVGR